MDNDSLHDMIDGYFEGTLTAGQERQLLQALLSFEGDDRAVDEALAVMGYARVRRSRRHRGVPARIRMAGIAAAAVAAVSVSLVVAHFSGTSAAQECYAYVGGRRVVDNESVMSLMDSQLEEMGAAGEDIRDEIMSDFADIRLAAEDI